MAASHVQALIVRAALDIQNLPGYKPRVKSEDDPFARILQSYYLRVPMQCALCGQWHKEGYIVELQHGGVTNIGHICGRRAWLTFSRMENEYLETQLRPRLIAKLHASIPRLSELADSTHQLRPAALQLGHRKKEFVRRFPSLSDELRRRASNNQLAVTESRERHNDSIEALLALNPNQSRATLRYEEVPVGTLRGLPLFAANIHDLVVVNFAAKVEAFPTIHFASLPIQQLNDWDLWLDSLDGLQRAALQTLQDGAAFFSPSNLTLLQKLATTNSERYQLEQLKPDELDLPQERFVLHPEVAKKLNRAERRRLQFKDKAP
jgi:hypothetical protein